MSFMAQDAKTLSNRLNSSRHVGEELASEQKTLALGTRFSNTLMLRLLERDVGLTQRGTFLPDKILYS